MTRCRTWVWILCLAMFGRTSQLAFSDDNPPGKVDRLEALRFEVSGEPERMRLFRADPELLNQKYVVHVPLSTIRNDQHLFGAALANLIPGRSFPNTRNLDVYRTLAQRLSADAIVPEDAKEFFQTTDPSEGFIRMDGYQSSADYGRYARIRILAPDLETAKQRASTLVILFQQGIVVPLRAKLSEELSQSSATTPKIEARLRELQQSRASLEKQRNALEIKGEELSDLKTQRRLLDVELAGLQARSDAIVRLRQRPENTLEPRKGKLDDLQISIEVDVVGVSAKRQLLDELIRSGAQRIDLTNEMLKLDAEMHDVQRELTRAQKSHDKLKDRLERCNSLFSTKNESVTISPIEWTET